MLSIESVNIIHYSTITSSVALFPYYLWQILMHPYKGCHLKIVTCRHNTILLNNEKCHLTLI